MIGVGRNETWAEAAYVIRWRPATGYWREARGWDRELAEREMNAQRLCSTGPIPTEAVYPDGEVVRCDYPDEYPHE